MKQPGEREYVYDAFISYRHREALDKPIAQRLQKLLEGYRPPRPLRVGRVKQIFRDQSDLPTASSLDEGIIDSLNKSRFLIVVCSSEYRNSNWCMRELEYFKALHNGSTSHILTLLVEGEPKDVFPPALLTTRKETVAEDGQRRSVEVPVEPLCADVRARTLRESMKKLRVEFLRIAAPIYGCSFDDLYRRHIRRKRRRIALGLSAALLAGAGVATYNHVMKTRIEERERSYRVAKSTAMAGYATAALAQDDTLLAMLLACEALAQPDAAGSVQLQPDMPQAEAALRSALAQRQYKQHVSPLSMTMQAHCETTPASRYNLLENDGLLLAADVNQEASLTIWDTKTGAYRADWGRDRLFMSLEDARVVRMTTRAVDGVLREGFVLSDLGTGEILREEYFADAGQQYAQLRVVSDIEYNRFVVMRQDEKDIVGLYDWDGNALAPEERGERRETAASREAPYAIRNLGARSRPENFVVDAVTGEGIYKLPDTYALAFFSDDYAYFSLYNMTERTVEVVSLAEGEVLCSWPYDGPGDVQSVRVLAGGGAVVICYDEYDAAFPDGGPERYRYEVIRLPGGEVILAGHGEIIAPRDKPWFIAAGMDTLRRYDINPLALPWDVAVTAGRYSADGTRLYLYNTRAAYVLDVTSGALLYEAQADPGLHYASAGLDAVVTVQDSLCTVYANGVLTARALPMDADACAVAVNDLGSEFAIGTTDGRILRVATASGDILQEEALAQAAPSHLEYGRSGLLASCGDGVAYLPFEGAATAYAQGYMAPAHGPRYLAEDNAILLWNAEADLNNFAIYDAETQRQLYLPDGGIEAFAYGPESGFLVLQPRVHGGAAGNMLHILRREKERFEPVQTLPLKSAEIAFDLDDAAAMLTINEADQATVYSLPDLSPYLTLYGCPIQLRGRAVLQDASTLRALRQPFSMPELSTRALYNLSQELLESPYGVRTLTEQERTAYPFTY